MTIAAGGTTSAGTVTITAEDDDTDSPAKSVTVSGTMGNSQGTGAVTGATLTITDDDAAPGATLALSASSIGESGNVERLDGDGDAVAPVERGDDGDGDGIAGRGDGLQR